MKSRAITPACQCSMPQNVLPPRSANRAALGRKRGRIHATGTDAECEWPGVRALGQNAIQDAQIRGELAHW